MNRAMAAKIERRLRGMGVYKPYVTTAYGVLEVESYPLTARLKDGAFDRDLGPTQSLTITDCTMPFDNQTIASTQIYIGQDALSAIGQMLVDFHEVAYARACNMGLTGFVLKLLAAEDGDVGHGVRDVEQEGIILIAPDEVDGMFGVPGGEHGLEVGGHAVDFDLAVFPKPEGSGIVLGCLGVEFPHVIGVHEAAGFVKATGLGTGVGLVADVPFPEHGGGGMSAPRYLIGSSIQDWYQMGLDARESAMDAFGGIDSLPPAISAWQFVLDNPELFGDCEEWPKDFPGTMPRDFRIAYNSGAAVAHA